MLIGHYAPALLLQRARPTVRLWQLFVAAQLVDFLWATFILVGLEHVRIVPGFTASNDLDLWDMPYTHGLVATAGWTALAFVGWRARGRRPTATGDAAVFALVVASHFALDFVVHVHDLPVVSSQGPRLGLGLWRDRTLAMAVETALFGAAALVWWLPRRGRPGAPATAGVLLGMTALAAASFYIPTPPSPAAMAVTGLATWTGCAALAARIERKSR